MIKQNSSLEVKINEKMYRFFCDNDSPLGSVHDAICQMKAYIVQRINDAHQVECESKEEPKVVEPSEVKDE